LSGDTSNNEALKDVEDVVDKVKAGGKAVAEKLLDPERDLEHEYVKGKGKEKENKIDSSTEAVQRPPKEIVDSHARHYKKILLPHDGSEPSDKALAHAIYLSKISEADIIILNAIEDVHEIAPTTISAGEEAGKNESVDEAVTYQTVEEEAFTNVTTDIDEKPPSKSSEELDFTIKGRLEQMIKERITLCRDAGVSSNISYRIQTGKALDQIVNLAKEGNVDLIIMVSGKIGSSIKGIMSNTRKVIDAVDIPVLVLKG
jgi:nucleotide-binding universal stress UspA family protein